VLLQTWILIPPQQRKEAVQALPQKENEKRKLLGDTEWCFLVWDRAEVVKAISDEAHKVRKSIVIGESD